MYGKGTTRGFAEYVKQMNISCPKNYFDVKVQFQPSKDYYELIKKRFYEFIAEFYKCQSSIIDKEYSREAKEFIIREIIISYDLKLSELSQLQNNLMNRYEVMMKDGESRLYLKRHCMSDSLREIAASEDCFDIIAALLRTEELSIKEAMSKLCTSYYIPDFYYATFGKLCIEFSLQIKSNNNSINSSEKPLFIASKIPLIRASEKSHFKAPEKTIFRTSEKSFGVCSQVIILNMCKQPDLDYRYILLYVDKESRFVVLRPIATNSKNEVSMELIKIFLDFGPPKIIECLVCISDYFIYLSKVMKSILPQLELPLFKFLTKVECVIDVKEIYSLIGKWCKYNRCTNWSIGIYVIQWLINSLGVNSPYNSVFKHPLNDFKIMSKCLSFSSLVDDNDEGVEGIEVKKLIEAIEMEEQAIDNEIVNENTKNINVILHTEKDLGINVNVESDIKIENDCIAPNLIDPIENDLTNDFLTMDNNISCKECNVEINEDIKCGQCKKFLHFYCKFTDVLKEFNSKITLTSLCRLCIIVNNRVKELKIVTE